MPNLAGWWLTMREPHSQSHGTFQCRGHMINKNRQGLWTPNVAGWWLRMRGSHPQSHVTHWSRCHTTDQRHYSCTFTRPMDPKISRVVTQDKGNPPTSHVTHQKDGHVINQRRYISSFTRHMVAKPNKVVNSIHKYRDTSTTWSRNK